MIIDLSMPDSSEKRRNNPGNGCSGVVYLRNYAAMSGNYVD
jgi:hypothetical protein